MTVPCAESQLVTLFVAYVFSPVGWQMHSVWFLFCRSLARRPEPLVSAWLVGASPLVQIYQSLFMAEGEASCAAEWAAFVQQNISTPIIADVTAGESVQRLHWTPNLQQPPPPPLYLPLTQAFLLIY